MRRKIPQPGLLYRTARHWNLRAEEMRSLAEEANDQTVRRMMRRIAADYDWLAEKADDRAVQDFIESAAVSDHVGKGVTRSRAGDAEEPAIRLIQISDHANRDCNRKSTQEDDDTSYGVRTRNKSEARE